MAFYLFNVAMSQAAEARPPRAQALERLRTGAWAIDPDSPHGGALAPGDLALIYAADPDLVFVGLVELASAVRDLARGDDGGEPRTGVVLSHAEEWDPPVPMEAVLARIDPGSNAKADFAVDVVRITPHEYETAIAVAAERHVR